MASKLIYGAALHPEFDALCAKVEAYLAAFPSAKEQGSVEWLIQRAMNMEDPADPRYVVGGSELGVLFKVDSFKSPMELLNEKITFLTTGKPVDRGDSPLMTAWGHIMEPPLARFVELKFGTRHFALEASVVHRTVKNFRYSPDGFVPVMLLQADGTKKLSAAVLELKNPFGRVVKDDGKVPEKYIHQVMSGIDVFGDLVTHGLFVEANYRVQRLSEYGEARYSKSVNISFKGASINGETGDKRFDGLVCHDSCIIGFYPGPKFSQYESVFNEIRGLMVDRGAYNATFGAYDLGALYEKTIFEIVMRLYAAGALKTCESEYLVHEYADCAAALDQVRAKIAAATPEANACWRDAPPLVMACGLFKYAWALHEIEPYYVAARRQVIENFVGRVKHEVEARGGLAPMFTDPAWVAPVDEDAELNERASAMSLSDTLKMGISSGRGKRVVEPDFD